MSFADGLLDIVRSRGAQDFLNIAKRVAAPAGNVMRTMSPASARIANDIAGVEDDMAAGMGRYLSGGLDLERWEKMTPANRILVAHAKAGKLSRSEMQRVQADPEMSNLFNNLDSIFAETNQENLAATDHLGNPLQVRNPFTKEKRPYEPIAADYYPRFVKRSKRNAILEPMNYAQAELERILTRQKLNKQGLAPDTILDPQDQEFIRDTASEAINEFFRTGQANPTLKEKRLLDILQPAYTNFKEITDHLRQLQVNKAMGQGQPVPDEFDPVIALFGSDDPIDQRSGIRMFRDFLLRDAQQARRFGSIESSRAMPLPDNWYEWDPVKVAPVYVMRQQRRLAEIKRFGQDNEVVLDPENGLLRKIADDRDRDFSKKIFDRAMGLEPYNKSMAMNKLMDGIFATQVIKLGTAQIAQLGQIMNSIMETGLGPTWQALSNLGKSRDIALKSGASLTRVMDIVREGLADPLEETGARRFTEGFLKWTGFNKADLFARHIGAGAGYAHGQEILRRAVTNPNDVKALREIRRLTPGISSAPNAFQPVLDKINLARQQLGNKPTLEQIEQFFQDELMNIARTASLNANFRQSILDMPGWATTPLGRLITMFRSYAFKQTNFIARRAIQDWRDRNPRTLIGLAAGAGILGPLVTTLKAIPQGRIGELGQEYQEAGEDPMKAGWKALENIASVGALGLFDQTLRAMRRGDTGWWEFMGGPLFTDVAQSLGGAGQAGYGLATGDEEMIERGAQQVGRFAASKVPVVGGTVRGAVQALTEDVERRPSGVVTRGQSQILGQESPPVEIGGFTIPSPRVLFGLEERVTAKRERYMNELKAAVEAGDMQEVRAVLQKARKDGVTITATSVRRLISDQQKQAREEAVPSEEAQS